MSWSQLYFRLFLSFSVFVIAFGFAWLVDFQANDFVSLFFVWICHLYLTINSQKWKSIQVCIHILNFFSRMGRSKNTPKLYWVFIWLPPRMTCHLYSHVWFSIYNEIFQRKTRKIDRAESIKLKWGGFLCKFTQHFVFETGNHGDFSTFSTTYCAYCRRRKFIYFFFGKVENREKYVICKMIAVVFIATESSTGESRASAKNELVLLRKN